MFKLYELIEIGKKEGKNVEKMLESVAKNIDCGHTSFEIFSDLYEEVFGHHLCDSFCIKFVEHLSNKTSKGKKWNIEQTNDVARKIGINFSANDYTAYEFFAAMHFVWYKYSEVLEESNITDPLIFGKLADCYLDNINEPKGKLVNDFFYIEKNKKIL
jgi:hypothetical protein